MHDHAAQIDPSRVPDPGEPIPRVAWPTVALCAGSLTVWIIAAASAIAGPVPAWVVIPICAAAAYGLFTVMHDAGHRSAAEVGWVNDWLGRVSAPGVAPPLAAFPVFRWIHMQHHRFTNHEDGRDPDSWTSNGPAWSWPFRWATLDLRYYVYYLPNLPGRPRSEKIEFAVNGIAILGTCSAVALAGQLEELLLFYVLPTRLTIMFLGFAFDFLPHHGLKAKPDENRYHTTRNRIGLEPVLNAVLLYQNYHAVHHLHPRVPFYAYLRAWRRNEETYVAQGTPLVTVAGRELGPDEYRSRRDMKPSGS
ncbi:MAG: fatty acid desaturase [Solirubrobacterales bacterium]